jgi:hypothetical protein
VLKQKFEKRGDHWIARPDPAGQTRTARTLSPRSVRPQ